ncbi:hypothetical protein ACGYK5_17060 [Sulfitobacter sp. 1A16787]|uniref:hypothetical protein n=1 Tax=Sulfitobacter sp. 1A16787 TaxID=3368571 RepID=UPI003747046E
MHVEKTPYFMAPCPRFAQITGPNIRKIRAALAAEPQELRPIVAQRLARQHCGALITPDQNHQPPGIPRLASFRLGRITGMGQDISAAISDWIARAEPRGRA